MIYRPRIQSYEPIIHTFIFQPNELPQSLVKQYEEKHKQIFGKSEQVNQLVIKVLARADAYASVREQLLRMLK